MRFGMGSIVPSAGIEVINPDPVVAAIQAMQLAAATPPQTGVSGMGRMSGLGCGNGVGVEIPWRDAYGNYDTMGKDVNMQVVPLAGLGDWMPASYSVPENPIMQGYRRIKGNALANNLAGLNAIDTSSLTNFWNSISTGTGDIIPGVSDLLVVGGAIAVLLLMSGSAAGRHR